MGRNNGFYTVEELRNRMSMSTIVFWKYRPICEQTLGELARHGVTRIELVESPEQFDMADSQSMRYIGRMCRSCGVEIVAFHAHSTTFASLDTEEKRKAEVDRCKRQIDSMLECGGSVWGSHAKAMDATLKESYEELARHVEGTGAAIAIENFKAEECWVEKRVAFLDEIDHPQVGMILDIGHVRNTEGINPMTVPGGPTKVLDACRTRLCWVHLHGFKDDVDHHPPLADGDMIQWIELLRALRRIGYTRHINFEPKGEPKHKDTIRETALVPARLVELEARTP